MDRRLELSMRAQPTDSTCGPTCLHAVYHYWGDAISLEQVVAEVPMLDNGGTLGVYLALHALRRGYRATIYSYNLQVFDPTWFTDSMERLTRQLEQQALHARKTKVRTASSAYLEYLRLGGRLWMEDLTKALIRRYLDHEIPILTGLSATFLYRSMRERNSDKAVSVDDDLGNPAGHFVVLAGYDRKDRAVLVVDPLESNPTGQGHYYHMSADRVIGAILLGIITYDANLVIITPPEKCTDSRRQQGGA